MCLPVNLPGRGLGGAKSGAKMTASSPGVRSRCSLRWAALGLAIAGTDRADFDDLGRQLIERIAAEHLPSRKPQEVIAARESRHRSLRQSEVATSRGHHREPRRIAESSPVSEMEAR